MWSNIFRLHIADPKVTMLVFDQLSVEMNQFLKFEVGNLLTSTWNIAFQSLKSYGSAFLYIIENIGFWSLQHLCLILMNMSIYIYTYPSFDIYIYAYICNLTRHTFWVDNLLEDIKRIFHKRLSSLTPFDSRLRHVIRTVVFGRFIINNLLI